MLPAIHSPGLVRAQAYLSQRTAEVPSLEGYLVARVRFGWIKRNRSGQFKRS